MLGVLVLRRGDAVLPEVVDGRRFVGEEDGGVRGDDELALAGRFHRVQERQEGELARGREGRFRLIEEEDAVREAVLEEREERFAVRHLVQRFAAVIRQGTAHERNRLRQFVLGVQMRREVEETLGA